MANFVKIGNELINLDVVARVSFVENQSGISDRIVISVGGGEMVVDSSRVGKAGLERIRRKITSALTPNDWESPSEDDNSQPL